MAGQFRLVKYYNLPRKIIPNQFYDLSWWFVYQQSQAQDRIDWESPEISIFLASYSITTHPNSTTIDISHGIKASVSISNLGLLYIRELSAMGSPIATTAAGFKMS